MLGKTLLPQNLTTLLGSALNGALIPGASRTAPVFEILRVGANLCVEHGESCFATASRDSVLNKSY